MDGGQRRMSIDNEKVQLPISPKAKVVHDPSLNQGGQINSFVFSANRDPMQKGIAEAAICNSKKLEDALQEIGLKIKYHEDNVKFLKAQKNSLDHSILDIQAALGNIRSEDEESSNGRNEEEETIGKILRYDKSAAGICCQLQNKTRITRLPLMKDVIGVVALLGKVDDDNLSRLVSHSIRLLLAFSTKDKLSLCQRKKILSKDIVTKFVKSSDQLANIFTKSLTGPRINYICNKLDAYDWYAPA